MKKLMIHSMALVATAFIASTTLAHDPSEHMVNNEEPKCAGMDHSKMDMTDPVAQAMMEQCSMSGDKQKMDMKHCLATLADVTVYTALPLCCRHTADLE